MFSKIYEKIKNFIKINYKELLMLLFIYLLFTVELPFSIYTPGGAVDLNKRISIEDAYEVEGSFNMAYVSMTRGSIPFILLSYVFPDWDIVKKEDLSLDGENIEEMVKRERLSLKESQDAAIINAYRAAQEELVITKVNNQVSYITEEANTNLQIGDTILEVNNEEVTSLSEIQTIINNLAEGDEVPLKVSRDGEIKELKAKIYKMGDSLKMGVSIIETYEYETKRKVEISSKASEMGSSGGLMMSLTVYNQLTAEDLTKGKKIVGTGTIDINGNVGEIGGVKYKLIGAVKNKADIFICPKENYEEAKKIAQDKGYNIPIIQVSTFQEAIEALKNI